MSCPDPDPTICGALYNRNAKVVSYPEDGTSEPYGRKTKYKKKFWLKFRNRAMSDRVIVSAQEVIITSLNVVM